MTTTQQQLLTRIESFSARPEVLRRAAGALRSGEPPDIELLDASFAVAEVDAKEASPLWDYHQYWELWALLGSQHAEALFVRLERMLGSALSSAEGATTAEWLSTLRHCADVLRRTKDPETGEVVKETSDVHAAKRASAWEPLLEQMLGWEADTAGAGAALDLWWGLVSLLRRKRLAVDPTTLSSLNLLVFKGIRHFNHCPPDFSIESVVSPEEAVQIVAQLLVGRVRAVPEHILQGDIVQAAGDTGIQNAMALLRQLRAHPEHVDAALTALDRAELGSKEQQALSILLHRLDHSLERGWDECDVVKRLQQRFPDSSQMKAQPTYQKAIHSDEDTGCRIGLAMSEVMEGPVPPIGPGVLLKVDLGEVTPELNGVPAIFLELPPVCSVVDLEVSPSGRFAFCRAGSFRGESFEHQVEDAAAFWALLDEEAEDTMSEEIADASGELQLGGSVTWETQPYNGSTSSGLGWFRGETPDWVQSVGSEDFGVDGPDWIYVGTVSAEFFFGYVHAFFNARTRTLRNIFECT